jgi:hypothetical protein
MGRKFLVCRVMALSILVLSTFATGAQAGWWGFRGGHFNDTGGIIPWSPDLRGHFLEIAESECERWNKVAILINVTPRYGDYVGFVCVFPRWYDPRKARLEPPVLVLRSRD